MTRGGNSATLNIPKWVQKPVRPDAITCPTCNNFSGYCFEQVQEMNVPITLYLDCMNCGTICIKLLGWDILTERRVGLPILRTLNL